MAITSKLFRNFSLIADSTLQWSIVVVICDIHKLSDEPFPEGISGRTSPSI
jgi:hypothetical protein